MPKRKSPKGGLRDYVFCLAPVITLVLAPIYLHTSTHELSDDVITSHVLAAVLLFIVISSWSIIGYVLEDACRCPKAFPFILACVQLLVVITAILSKRSPLHTELVPQMALQGPILSHMEAVASPQSAMNDAASAAKAKAFSGVPTPNPAPVATLAPVATPVPAPVATPAPAPVSWPKQLRDGTISSAWAHVGTGSCEDDDWHAEFNMLQSQGKTLQACADDGSSDPTSIAFDFSWTDGSCSIMYPVGILGRPLKGYTWHGDGKGWAKPQGSGHQRSGGETHCYMRTAPRILPSHPALRGGASLHTPSAELHPAVPKLIQEYCFRQASNQQGRLVNIVFAKAPFQGDHNEEQYHKYKNEILFLGISSLEDFPLPPPNPFSPKFPRDKYVGLFPGFLNMYRNPELVYPRHVRVMDMSQSDFALPDVGEPMEKKYDFTFSGSDQDIGSAAESECVGWSMFCKNWTFAKQALEVMCGEFQMTGVLVATKDKQDRNRCRIPKSCEGKVVQTTYLERQDRFFTYVKQSKFLFLPQVHDASPRVATQALALNTPVLMNRNIIGGWKYLNPKTGESFNDISDFRDALGRLRHNVRVGGVYEPRKYVTAHYGDDNSGARLKKWVEDNFADRIRLPPGTTHLFPTN